MSIGTMTELELAVEDYIAYKVAEGLKPSTVNDMRYRVKRLIRELGVTRFEEVKEKDVIQWFVDFGANEEGKDRPKVSANGRKLQWVYCSGFFRWAVAMKFIGENPVENAPRPKKFKSDRRKLRRAMTAEELEKLIFVAKVRPLAEYCKSRMIGSRHTDYWQANPITLDNVGQLAETATKYRNAKRTTDRLRKDGEKWALVYRTLALTGVRWGELGNLKVGRLSLDDEKMTLDSRYTKNGNSDVLPVPGELARDLKQWIEENKLGPDDKLFLIPGKGVKRFYRDIEVAGIPRVDAEGRQIDIHALRYSFGTMLARAGVHVSLAQRLMRHSKPELTIGIYTCLDSGEAKDASNTLPAIGSGKKPEPKEEPKPVESASTTQTPAASANDGLLKALLETADAETLRAALLKSMQK
ncbi:tyrosine-type recombinase/integrase [Pirellulaceae bacterium SH449]